MKTSDPPPETETKLSELLYRRLRLDKMEPNLWGDLSIGGHVRGAIDPPNWPGVEHCLERARRFIRDHPVYFPHLHPHHKPTKSSVPRRLLKAHEHGRADYQTERVAGMARAERDVSLLRTHLFGGQVLTKDESARLLESVAVGLLPPLYFSAKQIPLGGHDSRVCLPDGSAPPAWGPELLLRIEWGASTFDYPYQRSWLKEQSHCRDNVTFTHDGMCVHMASAHPDSVLDKLWQSSQRLAAVYPWEPHEALRFLLTDEAPTLDPAKVHVRASYGTRGTFASITMVIDPWLSSESVKAIYSDAQRRHFKRVSRAPRRSQFSLFDFVDRNHEGAGKMNWPALLEQWKTSKPPARFSDRRTLARAYRRTAKWLEKELFFPAYKIFKRSDDPASKAKRRSGKRRGKRG
ncbi:MAG: hypothetical protein ABI565_10280 [Vicinamibacteria bacterium]